MLVSFRLNQLARRLSPQCVPVCASPAFGISATKLDNAAKLCIDDVGSSASRLTMTSDGSRKIAFVASASAEAQQALAALTARYGNCERDDCDVIVALGGDGLMLQTL